MDQPPEDQATPAAQSRFNVDMEEYGPITQTIEEPTGEARLGTSITVTGPFQLVQYVDGPIWLLMEVRNPQLPASNDLTRLLGMFGLSEENPEEWLKQHGRMGT